MQEVLDFIKDNWTDLAGYVISAILYILVFVYRAQVSGKSNMLSTLTKDNLVQTKAEADALRNELKTAISVAEEQYSAAVKKCEKYDYLLSKFEKFATILGGEDVTNGSNNTDD